MFKRMRANYWKEILLTSHHVMISQLGGLGNLIQGITAASLGDSIGTEYKDSKYDFWCY
jgi:hypothetical protein